MFHRSKQNETLKKLEHSYKTHNRIEISKSAILHNLDFFTETCKMPAIPVLKGNAYGHGIEIVAKVLNKCNLPYIAVDSYFEALKIRKVSKQPVLIMGAIPTDSYQYLKYYAAFTFVVQDEPSIDALGKTGKRIKVHLECNTGMNRYGAQKEDIVKLTNRILSYKNLTPEGVMSHLADSDGEDQKTVDEAVDRFDSCVETIYQAGATPAILHVAQSAGSIKARSRHANTFRLGIGLYRLNPFSQDHTLHNRLSSLRPALKFISTITKVIELEKGDQVGYNYTFTAPELMKIGILPAGYYEGVSLNLSSKGQLKVGSHFIPVVGRVCMNHTIVNLDGLNTKVGDEVTVYSNITNDKNSIDNISYRHSLLNYSVLTGLNQDVRRILVD